MYAIYIPHCKRRVPATDSFCPLVMITCGRTTRLVLHLQIKAALVQRTLKSTLGGRTTKKIVLKLVKRWFEKVSAVIVLIFFKEKLMSLQFLFFVILRTSYLHFQGKKIYRRSIRDTYSLCVVMRVKRFCNHFSFDRQIIYNYKSACSTEKVYRLV